MSMNEDFVYFIKQLGRPAQASALDASTAAKLKSHLPQAIINFWQECGVGSWADGKFQFCLPDQYAGVVQALLKDDPQFDPEKTHLFGFGAFGDLLLWNEDKQNISVNLPYLLATADSTAPNWEPSDPDIALASTLYGIKDKRSFSLFDAGGNNASIFQKCVNKLGPPALGECYGVFPALALGGSTDIKSIKRANAREHFAILAQLGPVRLVDYKGGREAFIRNLGAAV